MNLNSILFPAPKCSYTLDSLKGELIWIPKFKKGANFYSTLHSPSTSSLATSKTRSHSVITYNTPMQKSKQNVSVNSPQLKLPSKNIGNEENSFVSVLSTKKSSSKLLQHQTKAKTPTASKSKPDTKKSTILIKRRIPSLKLDLFEQSGLNKCKSEESINFQEQPERISLCSTNLNINVPIVQNPVKKAPVKQSKYHFSPRVQVKVVKSAKINECDKSVTSFDPRGIDEYGNVQQQLQNSPRTMQKYLSKELLNPIVNGKLSARMIDSQANPVPMTRLKKTYYGSISLCPMSPQSDCMMMPIRVAADLSSSRENLKASSFLSPRSNVENSCAEPPQMKPQDMIENYIPCLLLTPITDSDKLVIYFHGNGEDINLSYELLAHVRDNLNVKFIKLN